jgi:hypothetical protein
LAIREGILEADIRKARERKEKEDAAEDAKMEEDDEEDPVRDYEGTLRGGNEVCASFSFRR